MAKVLVLDTIIIGTGGPVPPHCNPWAGVCTSPGSTPIQVAVDQKRHLVYVASYTENHVTVINGRSHKVVGSRIPVGSVPNGMGINEVTNKIYVGNWQDGTVSVISGATRQVVATVTVGSGAQEPPHCYEALKIDGCTKWGSMPIGPIGVNVTDNQLQRFLLQEVTQKITKIHNLLFKTNDLALTKIISLSN